MRCFIFLFLLSCVFSSCRTEISSDAKDRLLNGFIEFLNNLPNHQDGYEDGTLLNAQETDENYYRIEAKLKEKDSLTYVRCTSTLILQENGVSVQDNSYKCEAFAQEVETSPSAVEATSDGFAESTPTPGSPDAHKPVQLDNEVRPFTESTSGEQFVAVPREELIHRESVACIGCGSNVDPQAPGVADLAAIGIRQLDRHEPNVRHSLNRVTNVQRQVQVVNGVRYILTVLVDYNNCTSPEDEACTSTKTCKISVLEKPWIKLPTGGKYRAVVANNCTDTWIFGDNGEVIPEGLDKDKTDVGQNKDDIANTDEIKAIHNEDLQSQQTHKVFTDDEIKNLEEQIIPYSQFQTSTDAFVAVTGSSNDADVSRRNVEVETAKHFSDNSNTANQGASVVSNLSEDKKKTIDDLMNFFDFAGFSPPKDKRQTARNKRSYENDIKVMSLVDSYNKVKESLTNAKYIYSIAKTMVNYLNEIYPEKNRILKEVITAEEESENDHKYVNLQARVVVPTNEARMDEVTNICSGVIDASHDNPQVLTAFCHNDVDRNPNLNSPVLLPFDDKILQILIKKALKKLESDSPKRNAMNVTKMISASTQRGSGTLTKISAILGFTSCSKAIPFTERENCIAVDELGSKICDIQIFERNWFRDTQITYNCIDTPVDESFSNVKNIGTSLRLINDPKVVEMTQEALSYLETQSNRNNRQKVVGIKSVSTQLVAGLLTTIEFLVGYTKCKSNTQDDIEICDLLVNEQLRFCTVKIWHRPWLEEGKEMDVTCNDKYKTNQEELQNFAKQKSLLTKQKINPSDWRYDYDLAKESLEKYIQETGIKHKYEVVDVDKSYVEAKDGILYKLEFSIKSLDNLTNSDHIKCHSEVKVPPSLDEKKIIVDCEFSDEQLAGGVREKDPNDPEFRVLAEESMRQYLQTSGITQEHKIISVDKVTFKVVSGSLTTLDFTIKPAPEGDEIKCNSKVWEQRWLKKKEISVDCAVKDQPSRNKRQLVGGENEKDPSKTEFQILAKESMEKYLQSNGVTKLHRVVTVDRVTVQVVAGTITRLDFTISPVDVGDIIKCHSEVLEQPWLNVKDIKVDCDIEDQKSRQKRQMTGGITPKDPNEPQYKVLAEESMAQYLQTSGTTTPHRVVSVDEVTYQVVAGSLTRLRFTIKPESEGDILKCDSEVWEQKWRNKKEIKVDCRIQDQSSRQKRHIPGGITPKDPNDPQYKVLAEESMAQYLQTSGTTTPHRVVSVDEVTYQVVSGSLTRLRFTIKPESEGDVLKCYSKVWEQSWLDRKEINVTCDMSRSKRGIPGGVNQEDPSHPKYRALAEESMQKFLQTSGLTEAHELISVDEVWSQVVAGFITTLLFTIKPKSGGDVLKCSSHVFEQSWLDRKEINVTCDKSRSKRGIPGGVNKEDPSQPIYRALAEESMQKYLQNSGLTEAHELISVDEAWSRVVAGFITTLLFTIKPKSGGDVLKCSSHVFEQSWLDRKEINVTCDKSRSKRGIPGGVNKEDPSQPIYRALAEESMQKFLQTSGLTEAHELISVDEVWSQVVAGFITTLLFTIKPKSGGDVLKCSSHVFEQSWLDRKEINVSCEVAYHKSSNKRQLAGGQNEKDPSKTEFKILAKESMEKYLQSNGVTEPHIVVTVDRVTVQVVAGTITRLDFTISPVDVGDVIKCHSEVLEQPWLKVKDIKVDCNIEDQKSRQKRQMTGGITPKDPNEPQYKVLAEESMAQYLQTSGTTTPHRVVSVDEVTYQVVAGSMTRLRFTIKPESEGDILKCNSEVWEQKWRNKKEIKVDCRIQEQRSRQKRHIPGGITPKDSNDPQYKVLAEESMAQYLQTSGTTTPHRVVSVDEVTYQVVAGSLTRLRFTIKPESEGDVLKCYSKVWEQSWLDRKEINVTCDKSRSKRGIPGGVNKEDPSQPIYRALAEESMQKFLQTSGLTEAHELISVDEVWSQVVAGFITTLLFTIKPKSGGDILKCSSHVFEQSWLDRKEINVTCDKSRSKRGIPGGVNKEDPSQPIYRALAEESMQKYLQTSGLNEAHELISVDEVWSQVVAGFITTLLFTIKPKSGGDVLKCSSHVFEQSWLDRKEINVSCEVAYYKSSNKRQLAGGQNEKDPSKTEFKILAKESMEKYLQSNGVTEPHIVVTVDRVTVQVVAGTITRLDFTISPVDVGDVIKCHSEVLEQPWLKVKDIKVDCDIEDQKSRQKRQMTGGITPKDPNEPQYKVLAEESMAQYLQTSGTTTPHRVVSVDEVTYQVVAGSMTRLRFTIKPESEGDILKCNSEVWEQKWRNKKEIKVDCRIQEQRSRQKRHIPGGITPKDSNDPQYKVLAEESMAQYLQTSGTTTPHRVVSVDEVTYQVVAGSLTRLRFTIKPESEGDVLKCYSKVWEQSWLDKKEINVTCDKSRSKRGIPGGVNEKDPSDPKYRAFAEESMQKYLKTSGLTEAHEIISVDRVTYQVVAGSMTRLEFTIKPVGDGNVIKCHSEVFEQKWLNKKEITVDCETKDSNARVKRNGLIFVGGALEKNASDPKYKVLAEESMQKYLQTSGEIRGHRVLTVDKVTVQVVSGIKTRINFTITSDTEKESDVIKCYSEIWEIPWLQKKEISVNCEQAPRRAKRAIRNKNKHSGGLVEQDPSDPEYLTLAEDSLHKYTKIRKIKSEHEVLKVKKVTKQVVAGIMYRINFDAKRLSCASADIKHLLCTEANDNNVLFCFSKIWHRPWLKQKKIDVSCYADDVDDVDDDEITNHTVPVNTFKFGLLEEKDVNKKEYKELANLALKKYKITSKSEYAYKVDTIHHVTEQIAAGITTTIDFAAEPDCGADIDCLATKVKIHCQAELWERPGPKASPEVMSIVCRLNKEAVINKGNIFQKAKSQSFLEDNDNAAAYDQHVFQRTKRQVEIEDNDIEEELKYYYADAAVQNLNDYSRTDNLYKLITIHAIQLSTQMQNTLVRMYFEVASTFCLKHQHEDVLSQCDEMDGVNHKLCHARLYPSADDDMIVRHVVVICDDELDFSIVTGLSSINLVRMSIERVESDPDISHKLANVGNPYVIPSLDSRVPIKINFMVVPTNCSKDVAIETFRGGVCFVDTAIPAKTCNSFIFMEPHSNSVRKIDVQCFKPRGIRTRRWISINGNNVTAEELEIRKLAERALEKLEMESLHRYKQKILEINNYSSRITISRETNIDFEVGYTSCIKYEYVDNLESCQLLEHLPRRQCTANITETLWNRNGQKIDVSCKDDETPLEAHVEFLSAQTATQLSEEALRHVEARYPHPKKQKVVRVFSLEKQMIAGMHYRMKIEVGLTNCSALSNAQDCEVVTDAGLNKFCRVNVWIRPWTDHMNIFRVACDYQNDDYKYMYEDIQAQHLFFEFVQTYKPDYMNNEKQMAERFKIFRDNVKKMHEFNVRERGTATYGVTRFADLTYEEFSSKYLGLKPNLKNDNNIPMSKATIPNMTLPAAFDWRDHDAVTEVKDQGSCGSCWAFSVTGNIEGQWKMYSGNLVSLSEQELVDCDKLDDGCNGGLPDNAYRAIEQLGGLELETDYPYEGEDDKCSFNKTMAKVKISGAVNITSNETDMAKWLTQNGPISIGINANAMQFYMGGVSHPWKVLCNPKNLDHGVLIVGYGVKDYPLFNKHLPYWTIKNSWGKSWGEQGYYRVYRGDGTCGVNQMASSAVV